MQNRTAPNEQRDYRQERETRGHDGPAQSLVDAFVHERFQRLAAQDSDAGLKALFAPLAKTLADNEQKIVGELAAVQGSPVDIGGYYKPDDKKASEAAMAADGYLTEAVIFVKPRQSGV